MYFLTSLNIVGNFCTSKTSISIKHSLLKAKSVSLFVREREFINLSIMKVKRSVRCFIVFCIVFVHMQPGAMGDDEVKSTFFVQAICFGMAVFYVYVYLVCVCILHFVDSKSVWRFCLYWPLVTPFYQVVILRVTSGIMRADVILKLVQCSSPRCIHTLTCITEGLRWSYMGHGSDPFSCIQKRMWPHHFRIIVY